MIIYDLICSEEHRFEGWFDGADDFAQQRDSGMLSCPVCQSPEVKRLPSATHIGRHRSSEMAEGESIQQINSAELMRQVHDYVESNYDDVGKGFAEEAKRIFYGEADQRNIRGTATLGEVKELHEEGIQAIPLPPKPVEKNKLN